MPSRSDPNSHANDDDFPDDEEDDQEDEEDGDGTLLVRRVAAGVKTGEARVAYQAEPRKRTRVIVSTPDEAEELCVVDSTYALLETGVGRLELSLTAGEYQVRQRVGDDERIKSFIVEADVEEQRIDLEALPFASPIPLKGGNLLSRYPSTVADAAATETGLFQLLLRAPVSDWSTQQAAESRLRAEAERLGLEELQMGSSLPLELTFSTESSELNALFSLSLPPGPYVLTQKTSSGRQRCMPIWIREGVVTSVYLLSLETDSRVLPVKLDHAAVFMLRGADLAENLHRGLVQLEVARKALSLGRPVHGWTKHQHSAVLSGYVDNPLLYLMDAYLSFEPRLTDLADVRNTVAIAATILGDEFPDVIALRSVRAKNEAAPIAEMELTGPPILRRSWDQLISTPAGNEALGKLMSFSFQVDGIGAWFVWTEKVGSRRIGHEVSPEVVIGGPDKFNDLGDAAATLLRSKLLTDLVVKGMSFLRKPVGDFQVEKKDFPAGLHLTIDTFVGMLVSLSESGTLQKILKSQPDLLNRVGIDVDSEPMRQLTSSLRVLLDDTLVGLLGSEKLIKRALADLNLPNEQLLVLLKALTTTLVNALSPDAKRRMLRVASRLSTNQG